MESSNLLKTESIGIQSEVGEALVQLQFQDRVSQIMTHVKQNIELLPRVLEDNAKEFDKANTLQPLDARIILTDLEKTYAMAEERELHSGGNAEKSQNDEITFFEESDMAKTIMIVDDSASLRQVVGIALRGAGYDVVEGRDGADALSKLAGQKIHLIISDVNMPNMDGISFVKALKQIPSYKFTPVILLTTESQESKKIEGREAGAKAWMVKPFKPEQLLGAVQKLVLP